MAYAQLPDGSSFEIPPGTPDMMVYQSWPGCSIVYAPCQCLTHRIERARAIRMFDAAGIPPMYRQFTFESWQALPGSLTAGKELAYNICRYFAASGTGVVVDEQQYTGLVLSGVYGTGKTGLASCVINELLNRNVPVLWLDYSNFVLRVTDAVGINKEREGNDPSVAELIMAAARARFLLLDDMGEKDGRNRPVEASDWVRRMTYNALNERYTSLKPTLITTNFSREEFRLVYGQRLSQRVEQLYYWADMDTVNLRFGE